MLSTPSGLHSIKNTQSWNLWDIYIFFFRYFNVTGRGFADQGLENRERKRVTSGSLLTKVSYQILVLGMTNTDFLRVKLSKLGQS